MTMFVHNTGALDLIGLKSHVDDTYINDATVTFTVKDKQGHELAGETWPQTMTYVVGSNGNYRGILSADLELIAKQHYTAIIEADGGGERIGHFEVPFKPLVRTGLPTGQTIA